MPSLSPIQPQSPLCVSFSSFIFFFSIFSLFFPLSLSHRRDRIAGIICSNSSINASPELVKSSYPLTMKNLIAPMRAQNWGTLSPEHSSSASPILYALGQCYGGLSKRDCEECFSVSSTELQQCLPSSSGRIYLEGCFLRYDRLSFFQQWSQPEADTIRCGPKTGNITEPYQYKDFLRKLNDSFANVTENAVTQDGFGVVDANGGANPVYTQAQCWKTVTKS